MAARAAAVSPARVAAFDVLLRVFEQGAYADRALRRASERLDERDRALAQLLAFGAVQRRRTLDYAIEEIGRRRVARLDGPVRAAFSVKRHGETVGVSVGHFPEGGKDVDEVIPPCVDPALHLGRIAQWAPPASL